MGIYTISLNFIEKVQHSELHYLASILFRFTNEQNGAKLAVDKNNVILSKYKEIDQNRDIIKTWLDFVANIPSTIEKIDIDINGIKDSEEMCLSLCSHTNGSKKMIVYSRSSLKTSVDNDNCVTYDGNRIIILDKDEAKLELNGQNNISIVNSQIAGGDIKKSNNTNNGRG